MGSEREGPFRRYYEPSLHGDGSQTSIEALRSVNAVDDTKIEKTAEKYPLPTTFIPAFLIGGDFKAVYRRAREVLVKQQAIRQRRNFRGPYYGPRGLQKMALVVAAYHACRHTPRAERTKDWPRDAFALAALLKIDIAHVREAIYQSQYHRWEERYVPKTSPAVRVAQIRDALLHDVLRQNDLDDPSKVNANLYRTALQSEGAMIGSQKAVQVNLHSNVLNLPPGLTEDDLKQRLERVNRLALALKAKDTEATVIEQGDPS